MNKEFHYNITYIIALKAGFSPKQAYIIAYSSQFVDDNHKQISIIDKCNNKIIYTNTTTQVPAIPTRDQIKLLPIHHFLPGSYDEIACSGLPFTYGLTVANSNLANKIMEIFLNSHNLYALGIASHAYVDTWAHQNFIGASSMTNSIPGILASFIPNIGHADVLEDPDCLDCIWQDTRLQNSTIKNTERFLDAARHLYLHYCNFLRPKEPPDTAFLEDLALIFASNTARSRISRPKMEKRRMRLYDDMTNCHCGIKMPTYNANSWKQWAVYKAPNNHKYFWYNDEEFAKCHWWKFQEAAKGFQQTVTSMIKAQNEESNYTPKSLATMATNIC